MNKNTILISLLVVVCAAELNAVTGDYTFSCWLNGWRKNGNDTSADVFGIETSQYGFTFDVADFNQVHFGRVTNPPGYEQALAHKADTLVNLPDAQLQIELDLDGTRYRAHTCKAGKAKGVKHLQDVRLWESGRYVQHYDFLGLDLRSATGERLACDAVLDIVAWPGSLTFTLNVSLSRSGRDAVMRLGLTSEAGTWTEEREIDGQWNTGETHALSLTCRMPGAAQDPDDNVTVRTEDGQQVPVRFDETKDCYVASVHRLKRPWPTGYTDIRDYDEFVIEVRPTEKGDLIRFLLDMRPPANVTGLCPILCDAEGRPTGIPVQLSKNWHYKPMGSYLMAYAMLPADKAAIYRLRVVYGFYGTLPSASHAQLSLIGYGGHGRWDQLAIGCWGETICFDMDMSLVDVAITDIRMLMARNGLQGKMWSWTDAGWGGDWLNIRDASQAKYFQNRLKTAYLSQGPCLTDVRYEGYYGMNQEVDFQARVQTLRTDDYSRTFQQLSYAFTRDVSAQAGWLFKLGRTSHYATPRIAYGNRDGCLAELDVPATVKKSQRFLDQITLTGTGPWWVALPGAVHTSGRDWGTGYRALIIRDYQACIGGRAYTHPCISAPAFGADPLNLDIELLAPAGVTEFRRGDHIDLDLELITLPRVADDYYGPNKAFREHLTHTPNSWKTTHREAVGNDLNVEVTGGTVGHRYPLVVRVQEPEVTVTITGGVGAVPVRFEGISSPVDYRLDRIVNGQRIPLDQSVHGHDFWQIDYDERTKINAITFNLPLDGLEESTWCLAKGDSQ
jgi:hypothetical protein